MQTPETGKKLDNCCRKFPCLAARRPELGPKCAITATIEKHSAKTGGKRELSGAMGPAHAPFGGVHAAAGITLVELMVVVVIASLLAGGFYTAYVRFFRKNYVEKSMIEINDALGIVGRQLEKDIRMAGYYLPGNGIGPVIESGDTARFTVYLNKLRKTTRLKQDAPSGTTVLMVGDAAEINDDYWICMSGADTVLYPINRIGGSGAGIDSVYLKDTAVTIDWDTASANVFFAQGIEYAFENRHAETWLVRRELDKDYAISSLVDVMTIAGYDASGSALSGSYEQAAGMIISLGKYVRDSDTQRYVSRTFKIGIRNL